MLRVHIQPGEAAAFFSVVSDSGLSEHDKHVLKQSRVHSVVLNPSLKELRVSLTVSDFIKDISLSPLKETIASIIPGITSCDFHIDYKMTGSPEPKQLEKKNGNGFGKSQNSYSGNGERFRRKDLDICQSIDNKPLKIRDITRDMLKEKVCIQGFISKKPELRVTGSNKKLVTFAVSDYSESMLVKFWDMRDARFFEQVKDMSWVKVYGTLDTEFRSEELSIMAEKIATCASMERTDTAPEKRIELHVHTKMSALDATIELEQLVNTAARWKHPALAITDHGVVHQFPKFHKMCIKKGIKPILGLEGYLIDDTSLKDPDAWKHQTRFHVIIIAQNREGLKNLYKIVSISHLETFFKRPCILKSTLLNHRNGLILGSACEQGEIFQEVHKYYMNNLEFDDRIKEIAEIYDYFEIQPLTNNEFMVRKSLVSNKDDLAAINKKIAELAKLCDKPVVATTDAHFLNPEDSIIRQILQAGQGYKDHEQAGLYFRTTEEMLKEFSYLGEEEAYKAVIVNPAKICETVEEFPPVPKEFCPPKIEGSEDKIREMVMKNAHEMYGETLPEIVQARIDKELTAIINNKFSVLFLIAHQVVKKSLDMGYLVGSRGSVGSSFIATLCNITEVNPLPAHYLCRNCKLSEFHSEKLCGVDLPDKKCPSCGHDLSKQGYTIPFETFMGFKGEKVPDIDLNFSGDIQSDIHRYAESLFGKGHAFKAGTISTLAEKSAAGFVKNFFEEQQIKCSRAEQDRLIKAGSGIKRNTGQHPGGIIVVPDDREIYDFCPVQRPANDITSNITTTHFEYHDMEDQLVKLDLLGHDDPTFMRMLMDITGIDVKEVPLDDEKTMKYVFTEGNTLGIPEFNTKFVRDMVMDTRPKTFSDLVALSGLSHGTDVWLNNAQTLIQKKVATLDEVISTRDEIMNYLIAKSLPSDRAFKIMESVRKGKGLTEEFEALMLENNVPSWYIDSCKKIKYMFPKAHAVAYVTMAYRIAWFKTHHPLAFYSTYFTVKAGDFDANKVIYGIETVKKEMVRIRELIDSKQFQPKDAALYAILEVVEEMMKRGYSFLPVDLYVSEAKRFNIEGKSLRCSFDSLPGVGSSAAQMICEARDRKNKFMSIEDLKHEASISTAVIEVLKKHGTLKGLPDKNQLTLF